MNDELLEIIENFEPLDVRIISIKYGIGPNSVLIDLMIYNDNVNLSSVVLLKNTFVEYLRSEEFRERCEQNRKIPHSRFNHDTLGVSLHLFNHGWEGSRYFSTSADSDFIDWDGNFEAFVN